jgi:hypothetical protein
MHDSHAIQCPCKSVLTFKCLVVCISNLFIFRKCVYIWLKIFGHFVWSQIFGHFIMLSQKFIVQYNSFKNVSKKVLYGWFLDSLLWIGLRSTLAPCSAQCIVMLGPLARWTKTTRLITYEVCTHSVFFFNCWSHLIKFILYSPTI